MIKTILFDADGVLIKTDMFSKQLERDYGIAADKLTVFFTDKFPECLVGKADLREQLADYVTDWGWQGTVDDLLHYWFTVEHKIDQTLVDYAQKLRGKGIGCYVATNQEKYRSAYILDQMGFRNLFDGFYASSLLGYKKPSTEFFKSILDDLKIQDYSQVLFWDDSAASVESARQLGLAAEHYVSDADFWEKMKQYKLGVQDV